MDILHPNQFRKILNKTNRVHVFLRPFTLSLAIIAVLIIISTILSVASFIIVEGFTFEQNEVPVPITNAISNLIVALAIYELQRAISHELRKPTIDELTHVMRRSTPRFISVVAVSLSLEGLIMVIKAGQTNQLELLIYPAVIIFSAGVLLISLGIFLRLTPEETLPSKLLATINKPEPNTAMDVKISSERGAGK